MTSYVNGKPPSVDELITNAYAGIGRQGIGTGVQNIDQSGYDYWKGQIESGALGTDPMLPNYFGSAFNNAVQGALNQASTANTPQYEYIRNYFGQKPSIYEAPFIPGVTGDYGGALPQATSPARLPPPPIHTELEPPGFQFDPGKRPPYTGPYIPPQEYAPSITSDNSPLPPPSFTFPELDIGVNRPISPLSTTNITGLASDFGNQKPPIVNEYQLIPGVTGDYGAALSAQSAGGVSDQINRMYRDVLGRDADAEGLAYWTNRFGNQLTADDRALWMSIAKPNSNLDANQITALGDSTTWGYNMGNRVGQNMTDTAQSILSQDLGRNITINNMGVNGSSLGDAIARGDINKALNDRSTTVLLNYGMNEAYRNEDPAVFQSNLESVVQQMMHAGKDVVLQTPNYTEGIAGVNKYADIIRNVAAKYGVDLQDKWDLTSSLYNQYDSLDPVHPTEGVYQFLGNDLASHLNKKFRRA
jgi:lysophospholipase L1-like esterase